MAQSLPRVHRFRWWQFSLRSLLALTTIVCVVLGIHFQREQARQKYLLRKVTSFNALMDEERYAEAGIIAQQAHENYPSALTESMVEKATFANQWTFNHGSAARGGGCECGIPPDVQADADSEWEIGNLKEWEELTSAKRRR